MNPLQQEVEFQKQALENGQISLETRRRALATARAAGANAAELAELQQEIDAQIRVNGFTQENLNDAIAKASGQTSVPTKPIERAEATGQTAETEAVNQGVETTPAQGSIVADTSPAAESRVRFANPAKVYDSTTDTYSVVDETSGKTLASGLTEQEADISEQELSFQEVDQELDEFELNNIEAAEEGWTESESGLLIADEDAWEDQDGLMVSREDMVDEDLDQEPELLSDDAVQPSAPIGDQEGDYDGQLNGATVGTSKKPVSVNPKSSVPSYTPQSNPLHQYATYTYSISLFILSKNDFMTVVKSPDTWKPRNCLIASGGKHSTAFPRNAAFNDDFYFTDLSMTTVIGLNARSKGSNAIDISFNIVEPYGLTLLNRIMDASISVDSPNYIEMPYLLQIDFYGNDDAGKLLNPIPGQTKRIPIKIIEIKTKVGTRGSEYAVKAVPFNHQALQENQASAPVNLEVDAGTVEEFFKNVDVDINSQKTAKEDAQRQLISAQGIQVDDDGNPLPAGTRGLGGDPEKAAALKKVISAPFKSNSFTGAVNAFYKNTQETGACEVANEIRFSIDPAIGASKIVVPKRTDIKKTPIPNPGTKEAQTVNKKDAAGPDVNTSSFAINAGTNVLRVIDMVMRNSDYITSQIADPAKNANKSPQELANSLNKEMNWYKIIPEVELKQFDRKLNRWGLVTTYHIKPYIVYNSKHPWGPQTKPKGAVKEYNYIYTGKNNDIIDFSIDFDSLYYTAVSLNRSKYEALTTAQATEEAEKNNIQPKGGTNKPFTQKYQPRSDDPGAGGMQGQDTSVTKTANDIQNNIYSNSRGDMLNLKLKIIGDPQLVKQDDCYNNPGQSTYKSQTGGQIIPTNGSLVMDNGELYAKVSFKTPVDIDETTGLIRKDGKYIESVFSGMYKFLTVNNVFSGGKFEQTCDLVRMPDDVGDAPVNNKNSENTNRSPSTTEPLINTRNGVGLPNETNDTGWTDTGGVLILDEENSDWTDQDGLMISSEDNDDELIQLGGPDDEEDAELEELSGTEDEEEQLAEIVAETEEVDVIDWENENSVKAEPQPVESTDRAEVQQIQSQPSNTPRGRAIAEQQRVLDALQNDIRVYTDANAELQSNVDRANDAYDAAVDSGNQSAIKTAKRELQLAMDEKKNMSAKLKEAQSQIGEEEQKLKAI
jgi:hypothetical protein